MQYILNRHRFGITALFILLLLAFYSPSLFAQNNSGLFIKTVPIPSVSSSFQLNLDKKSSDGFEPDKKAKYFEFENNRKQIIRRMNEIQAMQKKAVGAKIDNNLWAVEKHILKALSAIKKLRKDHPDVKKSRRFAELYHTAYAEYYKFYGINTATNEAVGNVFDVRKELTTTYFNWELSGYSFPDDLKIYALEVPIVKNRKVKRHLMYYTQERPRVMESWLKRTEKYFPMMRKIFKQVGTPVELIHLTMIESGLNPRAKSWAAAMGMWQFMEETGTAYGLEVNWWVDQRRDPVKATRAAARHLKDLYERWQDWYLAIAGYNISPEGLTSAIRDAGGEKNYWSAWPYLPEQTQGYIPGFIAATMIERNPEKFGFQEDYDVEPYRYEIVTVAPLMPLDLLAKTAGISTHKLKTYNPELLRWATPPGSPYKLKLPPEVADKFLSNYKKIPEDARSRHIVMHEVEIGETLTYIANKYGITVRALYKTNEGLTSLIHPGQKIIIPLPGTNTGAANMTVAATPEAEKSDETTEVYYTVKSGDTIGHIAAWYDVSADQIRRWNNTSNLINVGDRLAIYVSKTKDDYYELVNTFSFAEKQRIEEDQQSGKQIVTIQYRVQSNDTLIEIAQTFNVSISSIKQANGLENSRIYIGQRLRINTVN